MKKRILFTAIAIFSVLGSFAQEKIKVDRTKSIVKWSAEYTFYFGGHAGTIHVSEGHLLKTNEKITGGFFKIDMNTIDNTDIDNAESRKDLVNHLKNEDFFDVKKYPTAMLTITQVHYRDNVHLEVKADLTIKGITLPIEFQAEISADRAKVNSKFKIDRTRWGVNYNNNLKDSAISDAIGFEVTLSL